VLDTLRAAGHHVSPTPTPGPLAAGRVAREAIEKGADLILALGGDGTVNELLPGVVHSTVPLAVIPAGTANVLAHELGIGTNPIRAAARLGELEPRRVSIGLLRHEPGAQERYFLLMAGAGFDAHIVYRLSLGLKSKWGEVAYWTAALKELGRRLEQVDVQVGEQSFACSFALASRVHNYGGYFEIARRAALTRDDFEIVLFDGRTTLPSYAKYLAAIVARKASNTKGMSFLRGDKAGFSASPDQRVYVQVDGEYAGRLPASVEIVPQALTILVPPEYWSRWTHSPTR
jgi:diacylglycerol kinase family enzyme